jgi:hypothetical protein
MCSGTFALGTGLIRDLGSGMAGEKWVVEQRGKIEFVGMWIEVVGSQIFCEASD